MLRNGENVVKSRDDKKEKKITTIGCNCDARTVMLEFLLYVEKERKEKGGGENNV